MSVRDAGRFIVSRAVTLAAYTMSVVGLIGQDWGSSDGLYAFRVLTVVWLLWCAVSRTVRHYHEDQEVKTSDRGKNLEQ